MISVAEAKKIIAANTSPLKPSLHALPKAAHKTLAEDVYAPYDIPAFPQSAVDGYGFVFSDWRQQNTLHLKGESAAGNNTQIKTANGNAIRIFTGAPVPEGVDTIVMQEKVLVENDAIHIQDEKLTKGSNVRPAGSEIIAGALALKEGSLLSAPAIAFLAGIGITEVPAFPDPVVSIIVTGNELQKPGELLQYGQVYESNSFGLVAALKMMHIKDVIVFRAADKLEIVIDVLQQALVHSDVVLITGGVSVGDYDFVLKAANDCGVTQLFHKVKQRPGKPLFFGNKADKFLFGLPGNPSSVLTCFYEYVAPCIGMLTKRNTGLVTIQVPLANTFNKFVLLTQFLKGYYNGETAAWLDAQESYRLNSFAKANCLIKIDEDIMEVAAGELVEIHLLPG